MTVGDRHTFSDGTSYYETEMGPMITWECDECGEPAAAALEYRGVVRCSACWPRYHGLTHPTSRPVVTVRTQGAVL